MGKLIAGSWQGDPSSHPTETYEYDFASIPMRVTTRKRQVREGGTLDVHRYVDGLGRAIQERHTAEPDPSHAADGEISRHRLAGVQSQGPGRPLLPAVFLRDRGVRAG